MLHVWCSQDDDLCDLDIRSGGQACWQTPLSAELCLSRSLHEDGIFVPSFMPGLWLRKEEISYKIKKQLDYVFKFINKRIYEGE